MIAFIFLLCAWFGIGTTYNVYKFCIKEHQGFKGLLNWFKESWK